MNETLLLEIKELRAQLAELKAERTLQKKHSAESSEKTTTKQIAAPDNSLKENVPEGHCDELGKALEDLAQTVGTELKNTNPITIVATFALGVLVGRLLSK